MLARSSRRRILITGATGFIGGALVERWAGDHEIYALYRDETRVPARSPARWIRQDLREPLDQARLPRAIDLVVHMAFIGRTVAPLAETDVFTVNAGCCAALTTYAAAAGARTFVYGSTGGVYGRRSTAFTERSRLAPFDFYTLSKCQGEAISTFRARWTPVILRYFYPYGPRLTTGIFSHLVRWVREGTPITIFNRAANPWINPVHIDDVCELTERAAFSDRALTLNCAGLERTNVEGLARLIGRHTGRRPALVRGRDPAMSDLLGAIGHARRTLGWVPRVTLDEGVRRTMQETSGVEEAISAQPSALGALGSGKTIEAKS